MLQEQFVLSGFGGQGVMFAGQLLAYAALEAGLEVTWIPSYGPEMRGGTAHCFVVISDKPIGSPVVRYPKVGIVFNNPSYEKYEPLIAADGLLVVNASLVDARSPRTDLRALYIPATDIAEDIGSSKLANMVLLGAVLQAHPVLPIETLRRALHDHIPAHRRSLLAMNDTALNRGAAFVLDEPSILIT